MAVSNWIDHLSAEEVAGAVYPGVGTEGILVLIAFVLWIGWHVLSARHGSSRRFCGGSFPHRQHRRHRPLSPRRQRRAYRRL